MRCLSIAHQCFRHPLVPLRRHLEPLPRPLTPLHRHLRVSVSLDAFSSPLNAYHTSPFNSSPSILTFCHHHLTLHDCLLAPPHRIYRLPIVNKRLSIALLCISIDLYSFSLPFMAFPSPFDLPPSPFNASSSHFSDSLSFLTTSPRP